MLRDPSRLWLLTATAVATLAVATLQPVSAAWAEDPDSSVYDIPLLESEEPAPITPSTPAGEWGTPQLPPGPVTELASAPPLPAAPPPPMGPGRTVYDATQGAGSAVQSAPSTTTATSASTGPGTPSRSTSGVAAQAEAAAPLAAVAPAPIYRLLARSTLRGVVHGTPYSYKLAI